MTLVVVMAAMSMMMIVSLVTVLVIMIAVIGTVKAVDLVCEVGDLQIEHRGDIDLGVLCPMDAGNLVQSADVLLDLIQLLRRAQVGFVEQDRVGERDLLAGFGQSSRRVEMYFASTTVTTPPSE